MMGMMMLWMMIVDEWLVSEGVSIIVEELSDCLVHMIFVFRQGNYCWSVRW